MRWAAGLGLIFAVAAVLADEAWFAAGAALLALAAAWVLDPPAVRATLRFGLVLSVIFAAAVTAAVVAWASGPARGLEVGGMVLLRLLVLALATAVLVRRVDAEALLRAADRFGMEKLGLVLGLALNALPRIAEAGSEVWAVHRLRSRGLRGRLRRLPGLAEVLLAHTARIADEAAAAASLRGHSALTRSNTRLSTPLRTVVVTGPPDCGKTEAVSALAEDLGGAGVPVAGFVQIGEREAERKVGFSVRSLTTGEEARLARVVERAEGEHGTRFRFFEAGFEVARKALVGAGRGTVLIIDELGPVELRGAGHMPAVRQALATRDLAGLVVVVRRSLVPSLIAALDAEDAVVVDVGENRGGAAEVIAEALGIK